MVEQKAAVQEAVTRGLLKEPTDLNSTPYGYFYDLDAYRSNLAALRDAFPSHWHHALAVKTNPVSSILQIALAAGHGAECASIGEVIHSLKLGFAGPDVVFDSPCKTIYEIAHALDNKVMLNIDNFQELARVKELVVAMEPHALQGCVIGLRINPLVGFGKVANLSVSTRKSKFGVICPIDSAGEGVEHQERTTVVNALAENHFVNAIHVHTGSGGMTLGQMADGAAAAADLALEVNALRMKKNVPLITVVDIGGGLPVSWGTEGQTPTFAEYSEELRQKAPSLFDGKVFTRVVTEMGAMMNCRFAFFASRVEVTKPTDAGVIAMIHAGSDQFLRACYAPQMRAPHPVTVFDRRGIPKTGPTSLHDIAGPLCFAGDIIGSAEVPAIEVGDIVVLGEAGGNTHSLRTTHCSRRSPPIYGYEAVELKNEDKHIKFVVLSKGTTYEQALFAWN